MLLITKRRRAAMIGQHCIYKVEDTTLVSISNTDMNNPDEQRYVKMFNAIDLSSNFYFSYSYDLTQTFQHNTANPRFVISNDRKQSLIRPEKEPSVVIYNSHPNYRYFFLPPTVTPSVG